MGGSLFSIVTKNWNGLGVRPLKGARGPWHVHISGDAMGSTVDTALARCVDDLGSGYVCSPGRTAVCALLSACIQSPCKK